MRKRNWPDRKNRKCPDCRKMLTYTRKDSFDRAVGNNSVCKDGRGRVPGAIVRSDGKFMGAEAACVDR